MSLALGRLESLQAPALCAQEGSATKLLDSLTEEVSNLRFQVGCSRQFAVSGGWASLRLSVVGPQLQAPALGLGLGLALWRFVFVEVCLG